MISARKARLRMALAALFVAATAAGAEEYTFDASAFEKKPFEIGGYVQLKQENYSLNPSGAYPAANGTFQLDGRGENCAYSI